LSGCQIFKQFLHLNNINTSIVESKELILNMHHQQGKYFDILIRTKKTVFIGEVKNYGKSNNEALKLI